MKPVRAFFVSFAVSLTALAGGMSIVSAALHVPPEEPRTPHFKIPTA